MGAITAPLPWWWRTPDELTAGLCGLLMHDAFARTLGFTSSRKARTCRSYEEPDTYFAVLEAFLDEVRAAKAPVKIRHSKSKQIRKCIAQNLANYYVLLIGYYLEPGPGGQALGGLMKFSKTLLFWRPPAAVRCRRRRPRPRPFTTDEGARHWKAVVRSPARAFSGTLDDLPGSSTVLNGCSWKSSGATPTDIGSVLASDHSRAWPQPTAPRPTSSRACRGPAAAGVHRRVPVSNPLRDGRSRTCVDLAQRDQGIEGNSRRPSAIYGQAARAALSTT